MTIDPLHVTNFNRSDIELQIFWLFCLMVAGKNADYVSKVLDKVIPDNVIPFDFLRSLGEKGIQERLIANRTGMYGKLTRAFMESLDLSDLRFISIEELEKVFGAGAKTSRFFLMHTRPDIICAALDTHILRWLREKGISTPKSTPSNKKRYKQLEDEWLRLSAVHFPKMGIAERDLHLWTTMSGRDKKVDKLIGI